MHKASLWIVHEAIDRNKVFHSFLPFHTWFPIANAILEAMEPFEGGAPLKECCHCCWTLRIYNLALFLLSVSCVSMEMLSACFSSAVISPPPWTLPVEL